MAMDIDDPDDLDELLDEEEKERERVRPPLQNQVALREVDELRQIPMQTTSSEKKGRESGTLKASGFVVMHGPLCASFADVYI